MNKSGRVDYFKKYYEKNKESISVKSKNYRKNNKEKIRAQKKEYDRKYYEKNSEKRREYQRQYYKSNPEKVVETNKKWNKNNPEKVKEISKKWKKNNPEKVNEHNRRWRKKNKERFRSSENLRRSERYKNEPLYRIQTILRARFAAFLKKNNCKKSGRSFEIFGATPKQIKSHIESQFKDDMTWENQGEWHIDHIIPLDYYAKNFDLNDLEVQKKAFNYKNLQPLWAFENLSKSNKCEILETTQ